MRRSGASKITILVILCFISILLSFSSPRAQEGLITVRVITVITKDNLNRRLSYPSSLYYDKKESELYVVAGGKVIVYTPDYFPYLSLGKGRGLYSPMSVFVDPKGNLFVCQGRSGKRSKPRISVYNAAFLPSKEIFFQGFKGADRFIPRKLAISQKGKIYVAGLGFRGVVVLDPQGRFLDILAPKDYLESPKKERVPQITDVTIDSKGRIYLLSEEMGRVYVYDKDEHFLFKFGEKGGSTGKLSRPRGIAVDDRKGRIYVIDYMRHTGNVYNLKGKFLGEFGGRGWGPGWFNFPSDIAVDDQGNVIVADTFNQRVQVLKVELNVPKIKVKKLKPFGEDTAPKSSTKPE